MMNKNLKRVLSLVCALALLLGMGILPNSVYAEESASASEMPSETDTNTGDNEISSDDLLNSTGSDGEETSTYREVTFYDFGIADQTISNDGQMSGELSDVENLDGVAFTGKLQMGLCADMLHSFRLGGKGGEGATDATLWSGVGLWTEANNQLAVYYYTGVTAGNGDIVKLPIADYGITYDETNGYSEFKIRMTFDYIDGTSDIKLTISVNDILAYDGVLTDAQNYFGNQLRLWAHGGKDIAVKSVEDETVTYREVTFSDFGIADQTVTEQLRATLPNAENLDGVAFTGYLQMGLYADGYHSIRLGGRDGDDNAQWCGVSLWTEANNQLAINYLSGLIANEGDVVKIPIANYGITYDETTGFSEFKLRMTFDYIDGTDDIKLTISINDILAYKGILTDAQNYFGNHLHLWANGGKTITVKSVEAEPVEYREVTFSDFGIADQTVSNDGQMSGELSDAENLDGVAFTGYMQMGLCADMMHSFRIGGKGGEGATDNTLWSGVGLWTEANNQLAVYYYTGVTTGNGDIVKLPIADYGITYDETNGYSEFKIRVTFDYIDGTSDIKLTISVNDILAYNGVLTDAQNYFGNQLRLWAHGGKTISVKSVELGNEDVGGEEEEPVEYREVTFSDFEIADQVVYNDAQVSGALSGAENLDGVAFTGYLQMGLCADMMNSFRIGGKEGDVNNNWSGVGLWTEANNQLAISYYTGVTSGSDIVKLPIADYGITYDDTNGYSEFKVRMTFNYIESTSDIKLTISVNDILAYDGVLTNAQNYFGNELRLWAHGGKTITAKSVTDETVAYREVTFSDFGIVDQTISNDGQMSGELPGVDNLDGVAFTGKLQMGLCADMMHSFRIGGKGGEGATDNTLWSGVGLWTEANNQLAVYYYTGVTTGNGDIVKLPIAKYGITYDETNGFSEFEIRVTFDYIEGTADIQLAIYINDLLAYNNTLVGAQNYFGNQLRLWAHGGKTITVKSVEEEKTYREVTFSDFDIADQTISNDGQMSGELSGVDTLDGVAFTGYLQMGLCADMMHSFRLGGKGGEGATDNTLWSGVGLWTEANNQLAVYYYTGVTTGNGDIVKLPTANYGITYDETTGFSEFKLRMTIDYIDGTDDIKLTISINDILAYKGVLLDAQNYFGNQLRLWAHGGKDITVTSVADGTEEDPEDGKLDVAGTSMTLHDSVSVNFYVNIEESVAADATMQVTIGDGEPVSQQVSGAATDSEGNYIFVVDLAAAQMTDTITLQLLVNGEVYGEYTYSVREYADSVLADESLSEYHELVKHMLNYGAAAQDYFEYNDENPANKDISVEEAEVPNESPNVSVSGDVDGISFYGASLVFESKIAVRFYFNVTGNISDYTFAVGAHTYELVEKAGLYYVEIPGINPQALDELVELYVSDATGSTLAVTYSPMYYIERMYNGNGSDSLKKLLKAMYGYYLAAEAFVTA